MTSALRHRLPISTLAFDRLQPVYHRIVGVADDVVLDRRRRDLLSQRFRGQTGQADLADQRHPGRSIVAHANPHGNVGGPGLPG